MTAEEAIAEGVRILAETFPWMNPLFDVTRRQEPRLWHVSTPLFDGATLAIKAEGRARISVRVDSSFCGAEADDVAPALGWAVHTIPQFGWAQDADAFPIWQAVVDFALDDIGNGGQRRRTIVETGTKIVLSPSRNAVRFVSPPGASLESKWLHVADAGVFAALSGNATIKRVPGLVVSDCGPDGGPGNTNTRITKTVLGWTFASVLHLGERFSP